jgi:hypothetical protein
MPPEEVAAVERRRQRPVQRFDATSVIPPSVAEMEGAGERRAAEKYNRETRAIRNRIRETASIDDEVELASRLFPDGLGKPTWGPSHE